MPRWQNEEEEAWRLIFGGKPKYTKTYVPRAIPNAPPNAVVPPENARPTYTSPFARNGPWQPRNSNNSGKQFSTIVVQSNKPLTTNEHNKLLNKIKQVTAV